ncbi:ROK family transcriptional regulator [Rhizobium terrae]|uniref:ROK family transcriptional regulator n=1 Tax=Rhizobium terrae TaxID=2171756 RepID=UPI000E3BC95E|nr:ROK family transcriptional regulator [Rhizobium terrae]
MIFHQNLNGLQRKTLENIISGRSPSRFELASQFGVSPQTMTRAVKALIDEGVVDEQVETTGQRGQPSRRLVFKHGSLLAVGLVLANDRLIVIVEDLSGNRLSKDEVDGDFREPGPALIQAAAMVEDAIKRNGGREKIVGIGIAAQGFFIEKSRRLASIGSLAAWAEIDIKTFFEERFSVPATVQNDAKTIAVGTIREGFPRHYSHYFCFYLGSGIGGALVSEGRLYEGASANAGELGSFVTRNDTRPTVPNFLKIAGLRSIGDWPDSAKVDGDILGWCRSAGEALSQAAQIAVRSYDVEFILVCSNLPQGVLRAICSAVRAEPIGANLLDQENARRLLRWPIVIPISEASLNSGACALATYNFLHSAAPAEQQD